MLAQGLRLVQAAQVAAAVLGTLCALGLSVALGRGVPALSKMPALLSAGQSFPSTLVVSPGPVSM